ncbi:hypothetical protein [Deinococcus yunweiensis]|uniref:hypothetical protein n=1 Tax=Deinococcus yunweiensis TaxID=367282 RepID=UPI00398EA811
MTHPVSFRPPAHDTDLAGAARRTGPGLRLALHDAGCWRILEEHGGGWRERTVLT